MEDSNKKQLVTTLTEKEYAEVFTTYREKANEHAVMYDMAKPVCQSFQGKPIDFLSIGPANGIVEDNFMKRNGLRLRSYHAVEPNNFFREELKTTISEWSNEIKCTIEPHYFTPNYPLEKKFDLVLICQSLYAMPDKLGVIKKAHSLLKKGGKLMIFHQSKEVVTNQFIKTYLVSNQINDENVPLNAYELSDMLKAIDMPNTIQEELILVDVDDYLRNKKAEDANHVMELLIQVRIEELNTSLRSELRRVMENVCVVNSNGKYEFHYHQAMIVVE